MSQLLLLLLLGRQAVALSAILSRMNLPTLSFSAIIRLAMELWWTINKAEESPTKRESCSLLKVLPRRPEYQASVEHEGRIKSAIRPP